MFNLTGLHIRQLISFLDSTSSWRKCQNYWNLICTLFRVAWRSSMIEIFLELFFSPGLTKKHYNHFCTFVRRSHRHSSQWNEGFGKKAGWKKQRKKGDTQIRNEEKCASDSRDIAPVTAFIAGCSLNRVTLLTRAYWTKQLKHAPIRDIIHLPRSYVKLRVRPRPRFAPAKNLIAFTLH